MEIRTQGKRFRKPQSGNSNLRERWRFLSAGTNDVLEGSTPRLEKKAIVSFTRQPRGLGISGEKTAIPRGLQRSSGGYDIDGDGQVDIREMRLAKFLDAMVEKKRSNGADAVPPPDHEVQQMKQQAGRLLIAKEFIERNQGQLWRYGSIFVEKDEQQSAEFIAHHKKFAKLMAYLESVERKRVMRSSRNVRGTIKGDREESESSEFTRRTWVESVRKVNDPLVSRFPLPDLEPKPRQPPAALVVGGDSEDMIVTNKYGAVDVDGDGIIDDDEMRLNLRIQEATLDDKHDANPQQLRKLKQLAGRRLMARDFVKRNEAKMWIYDARFKGRSTDDIVDELATSETFAKEINRLRAKERVLTLKSSSGVAGCIVQAPVTEIPNDPTHATEFRRVKHRTELLQARKELLKPPEQRLAALLGKQGAVPGVAPGLPFGAVREEKQQSLSRARSESQLVALPKLFDSPRRIEPIGCFSVTKWKLEAHK
ncbi:hypothetical protein P43SY_009193 [Pythium insidiosum]|uniref:Uncharacterized protein n=1 Tax=Pythium insidiosum TaxID=114742 RepID=A0AAD5MAF3_PYTIN|nr:hypothetical protein P43SY_009193 [Pythium insidiosum]